MKLKLFVLKFFRILFFPSFRKFVSFRQGISINYASSYKNISATHRRQNLLKRVSGILQLNFHFGFCVPIDDNDFPCVISEKTTRIGNVDGRFLEYHNDASRLICK